MKKEEYLRQVRKQIHYIFDRDSIEEELKEHLEDSIQDFVEQGFSYEKAEEQAVLQMGDPMETGKLLNKEHQPIIGYLYTLSKIFIVLLVIPLFLTLVVNLSILMENAQPVVTPNSVSHYSVNMDFEISTHRIRLDNICLQEDGTYSLTFRMWKKLSYSRAGWSSGCFLIEGTDGERLDDGGGSSGNGLFSNAYKFFKRPKDDILILNCNDGQRIELNMKEYIDE